MHTRSIPTINIFARGNVFEISEVTTPRAATAAKNRSSGYQRKNISPICDRRHSEGMAGGYMCPRAPNFEGFRGRQIEGDDHDIE